MGDPEKRFNEDALRMMRAVRFASQLNFTIDPETITGIEHHGSLLTKIAVERIHVEFVKMLLGQWPAMGLDVFMDTGLYQDCPDFKPYKDQLEQLQLQLKSGLSSETAVWTILCAVFGLSSKQVNRLLKDWKSANQLIDDVQVAVKAVKAISEHSVDAWLLYQTGSELLPIANEVANQLGESPYATATLLAQYDELQIHSKKALAITGQDLMSAGIKPGPQTGASTELSGASSGGRDS